jgi:hypothetical protein
MLIKTGEASIIDVVNPEEVQNPGTMKSALDTALDKAKLRIGRKNKTTPTDAAVVVPLATEETQEK